jgi:hypothetical protein
MSERNGQSSVSTGTAEIPVVRNVGSTAAPATAAPDEAPTTAVGPTGPPAGEPLAAPEPDPAHMTAPVTVRPSPRLPRRGPFAVVGLGSFGVAGVLLADEVRMVRQGSREAAVRPAYVEVTAGLLNGLTPARLLLLVSAFVLFLAAYVSRG